MIFADLSVCMYEDSQYPITKAKKADGSEQLFVPRYLSFIKDFGETEETADLSFRMYNPSRLGNPWFMSFSPMPWQTPGTADDEGRLPRYDDTFEDAEAQRQWDSMSSAQKNLYYYINHAGGFSDNARKSKVYGVQTNGSVVRLHANSVHDIQPGIEIVVPQKKVKKKMTTGEIVGITSGIASLGAIIVALLNVLKK